jgi:transcription elongation factor Elf1
MYRKAKVKLLKLLGFFLARRLLFIKVKKKGGRKMEKEMEKELEICPRCGRYVEVEALVYKDGDRDLYCKECGFPVIHERSGMIYEQVY